MDTTQMNKLKRLTKQELIDIIDSLQVEIRNLRIELVERRVHENLENKINVLRKARGSKSE